MKKLITSAVAALMLMHPALSAKAESLDIAATEYPPFYGSDLDDQGFMSEIILTAFGRAGYDADVSFLPWRRALEGTRDGKHDALYTMWYRQEREEHFIFSDPLPPNELVFLVRAGDGETFDGYDTLTDKRIGVVRGYAPPPGFAEAGLAVSEGRDDEENLRKLLRGRVDLVLADRIVAQHIINTAMPDDAESFGFLSPPVHVDIQYMVVPKATVNAEALMGAFNGALAEMRDDGTVEAIMGKHGF